MSEPLLDKITSKEAPKDRNTVKELPIKTNNETESGKIHGRQSAISGTVSKRQVADRILDLTFPMSVREIMETSKEIRTEFQDMIKVKNMKAVYLGHSADHPLLANLGWPRTDGILIKIEMETGGTSVCAIIDTGSQLQPMSVPRARIEIFCFGMFPKNSLYLCQFFTNSHKN
jgi:hypothetical protein